MSSTPHTVPTKATLAGKVLLVIAFLLLSCTYLRWTWCIDVTEAGGDSAGYVLAAQYFSPFWEPSSLLKDYGHSLFYPPLFPILIGLLGGTPLAGHIVVAVSLLAAVLALYAWLNTERLNTYVSAAAAIAFALLPGTYFQALNIWTENAYLFTSLLAIWLVTKAEVDTPNRMVCYYGAATAIAAATLIRVAALPLLAAFLLYLLIKRPRGLWRVVLLATLPFLIWVLWSGVNQVGVGGYTSQWVHLYSGDFWARLSRQVHVEAAVLRYAWLNYWLSEGTNAALSMAVQILGILALIAWVLRLYQRHFDALYVLVYLVQLFAWPHPEEAQRYGSVLVPVLLSYSIFAANYAGRRLRETWGMRATALTAFLFYLLLVPTLILTVDRFTKAPTSTDDLVRHTEDWYRNDIDDARSLSALLVSVLDGMRQIRKTLPPDECVFNIKPNVMMLYSRHLSITPPASSQSDEKFREGIKKCRYAYTMSYQSHSFSTPFYPSARLPPKSTRALTTLFVTGERGIFHTAQLLDLRPDTPDAPQ